MIITAISDHRVGETHAVYTIFENDRFYADFMYKASVYTYVGGNTVTCFKAILSIADQGKLLES